MQFCARHLYKRHSWPTHDSGDSRTREGCVHVCVILAGWRALKPFAAKTTGWHTFVAPAAKSVYCVCSRIHHATISTPTGRSFTVDAAPWPTKNESASLCLQPIQFAHAHALTKSETPHRTAPAVVTTFEPHVVAPRASTTPDEGGY